MEPGLNERDGSSEARVVVSIGVGHNAARAEISAALERDRDMCGARGPRRVRRPGGLGERVGDTDADHPADPAQLPWAGVRVRLDPGLVGPRDGAAEPGYGLNSCVTHRTSPTYPTIPHLGGRTFGAATGTGRLLSPAADWVTARRGSYRLTVPAASAALLTFGASRS